MKNWKVQWKRILVLVLTVALMGNTIDASSIMVSAEGVEESESVSSNVMPESQTVSDNDALQDTEIPEDEKDEESDALESQYKLLDTVIVGAEADSLDNDELFDGYVEQMFYGNGGVSFFAVGNRTAGARLTGDEKLAYDALVSEIKKIAAGERTSTVIAIGETFTADGTTYTADVEIAFQEGSGAFDGNAVIHALLSDLPYELYWYDKTIGCAMSAWGSETELAQVIFSFPIAANYQGANTTNVNTTKVTAAKTAVVNAQTIVNTYAGYSDYEKLVAYKTEICNAVVYDDVAAGATGNYFSTNIDPWQLVSVFDGDSNTNVVCEGYSKAFQYLCDMSTFSGDVSCYSVTGNMTVGSSGGGHMWNIVTWGSKNFLVDVTNCDGNSIGNSGGLFLDGLTGSVANGYSATTANAIALYTYDPFTTELWGTDADSILNLSEKDAYPVNVTTGGNSFSYADLQDAVDAIAAGGQGTVTLCSDVDLGSDSVSIVGKTVTLDLNGHSITGSSNRELIAVGAEGTATSFTVTGSGNMENTMSAPCIDTNAGAETVTLKGNVLLKSNGATVVRMTDDDTLNIQEQAILYCSGSQSGEGAIRVSSSSGTTTVNMTGGTLINTLGTYVIYQTGGTLDLNLSKGILIGTVHLVNYDEINGFSVYGTGNVLNQSVAPTTGTLTVEPGADLTIADGITYTGNVDNFGTVNYGGNYGTISGTVTDYAALINAVDADMAAIFYADSVTLVEKTVNQQTKNFAKVGDTITFTVTPDSSIGLSEAVTVTDKAGSSVSVTKVSGDYNVDGGAVTFSFTMPSTETTITANMTGPNIIEAVGTIAVTYDGTQVELSTVKGEHFTWKGNGNATLTYYSDTNGTVIEAPVAVGNYYVKVTVTADNNYQETTSDYIPFSIVTHVHSWTFRAEGNTITATCADAGNGCTLGTDTIGIIAPANLIYNGTAKEATIEGAIDGVDAPDITYSGNRTNAGDTCTASITMNGATAKVTFTVKAADITVAWTQDQLTQTVIYSGQTATIEEPIVTLVNNESYSGEINYSYRVAGATGEFTEGLPVAAGTYTVRAEVAAFGNYHGASSANEMTLTISPASVTPAITLVLPEGGYVYDGSAKEPAVTVKSGTTVIAPEEYEVTYVSNIEPGTATVTITDKTGGNYMFSEDSVTFNIAKATAQMEVTVLQNLGTDCGTNLTIGVTVANGGIEKVPTGAVTLEILNAENASVDTRNITLAGGSGSIDMANPAAGIYTIKVSYSGDSYYSEAVNTEKTITTTHNHQWDTTTHELKCNCGNVSATDAVVPSAIITVKENSWKDFLNTISFGVFFKETKDVTVTTEDADSGVAKTQYYLAGGELANPMTDISEEEWITYSKFSIAPNRKVVVYVRVTDCAGNTAIYHTDGIVLYTDSVAVTNTVNYTYQENADRTLEITLNGNTIKEITNGSQMLVENTDYTVNGGTITLKAAYLDSLDAGDYTLGVSYYPMDMTYVETEGNEAPATSKILLKVAKAALSLTNQPQPKWEVGYGYKAEDAVFDTTTGTMSFGQTTVAGSWELNYDGYFTANGLQYTATFTPSDTNYQTFTTDYAEVNVKPVTPVITINPVNAEAALEQTVTYSFVARHPKYAEFTEGLPTGIARLVVDTQPYTGNSYIIPEDAVIGSTINVSVQFDQTAFYNEVEKASTITVTDRVPVTISVNESSTTVAYAGSGIDLSTLFAIDSNAGSATYTVENGTGEGTWNGSTLNVTKTGTFIIKVNTAINGMYAAGEAMTTLTVTKGVGVGRLALNGWTYGENANSPVVSSTTNATNAVGYLYEAVDGSGYRSENAPTEAGSYKITATLPENELYQSLSISSTFVIETKDIAGATVSMGDALPYNGEEQTFAVGSIILADGTELSAEEYTVAGNVQTNAGTYTLTVTGKGNYGGTVIKNYTITPLSIENAQMVLGDSLSYTGQAQTQTVRSVTVGVFTLTAADYTVTGNVATDVGTYTLTITGKGNFTGIVTKEYTMGKMQLPAPEATDGAVFKLELEGGISQVPEALRLVPNLDTPEEIELEMQAVIVEKNHTIAGENIVVYDVALMYSEDGGATWIKADEEHFPDGGLTVQLPYPQGTGKDTHIFTVAHMFTSDAFGMVPGTVEYPSVTNGENGIVFEVTGLSPISVGWELIDRTEDNAGNDTGNDTEDNTEDNAGNDTEDNAGNDTEDNAGNNTEDNAGNDTEDNTGNDTENDAENNTGDNNYTPYPPVNVGAQPAVSNQAEEVTSPKTDDLNNMWIGLGIMLVGAAFVSLSMFVGRRKKNS